MFNQEVQDVMNAYVDLLIWHSDLVYSEPTYCDTDAKPWLDWFGTMWQAEIECEEMFDRYIELVEAL